MHNTNRAELAELSAADLTLDLGPFVLIVCS